MDEDITNENDLPVGKSVLQLNDIRSSTNYTCIASSSLGVIEALAMVKVQCKLSTVLLYGDWSLNVMLKVHFSIKFYQKLDSSRPFPILQIIGY